MDGIFSHFRSLGKNLFDDSLVTVLSDDFCTGSNFCSKPISGGPAKVIIDGNESTAWANLDMSELRQKVVISFKRHVINLHGFSFQTACGPPASLKLEGSHDLLYWNNIHLETTSLNTFTTYNFECQYPGSYQHFRLSQIGQCVSCDGYRFHVLNIKFDGEIREINYCSHDHENLLMTSLFLFFLMIFASSG